MDPGIQSKLISFAGLLVANDCFFLHDIIAYIIQPIIKVQMTHPHGEWWPSSNSLNLDTLKSEDTLHVHTYTLRG